jgi:hypothetical protein
MKNSWEDLWLFVLLAPTLCAIFIDKLCKPVQRMRARWVLWCEDICAKHGRIKWCIAGCFECREEKTNQRRLKLRARAAKRDAKVSAAMKVLGVNQ